MNTSSTFWAKPCGNMQYNFALVVDQPGGACRLYFMGETSEVFDQMEFPSRQVAEQGLARNEFAPWEDPDWFPPPPYQEGERPEGAIYSGGKYWRDWRVMVTGRNRRTKWNT